MNQKRDISSESTEIAAGAVALKAHGDAILDGTHGTPEIPAEYGYALLAVAGWLNEESKVLNLRTRPYALAVVRAFIYGEGAFE